MKVKIHDHLMCGIKIEGAEEDCDVEKIIHIKNNGKDYVELHSKEGFYNVYPKSAVEVLENEI